MRRFIKLTDYASKGHVFLDASKITHIQPDSLGEGTVVVLTRGREYARVVEESSTVMALIIRVYESLPQPNPGEPIRWPANIRVI